MTAPITMSPRSKGKEAVTSWSGTRAPRSVSGKSVAVDQVLGHDGGLGERSARAALTRLDAHTDVPLVAAADGDDAVLAGDRIAQDQGRDVDFEHVGDGADDRFIRGHGFEAGVDGAAEAGQAPEQRGPFLERLPLASERERDGHAIAHDGHRVEVAIVELGVGPALDVEHAEHRSHRPRAGC